MIKWPIKNETNHGYGWGADASTRSKLVLLLTYLFILSGFTRVEGNATIYPLRGDHYSKCCQRGLIIQTLFDNDNIIVVRTYE